MDAAQRQLEAVHVGQNPLQQTALDVWSSEQHNKARLLAMHPLALDEMQEPSSVPVPNDAELNEALQRGSGALSQIADVPDSTNVGHPKHFRTAISALFAKTAAFKERTTMFKTVLADFQLSLIKRHYLKLRDYWECTGRPVGLTHTCFPMVFNQHRYFTFLRAYWTKMHSLSWIPRAAMWQTRAYTNGFGVFLGGFINCPFPQDNA